MKTKSAPNSRIIYGIVGQHTICYFYCHIKQYSEQVLKDNGCIIIGYASSDRVAQSMVPRPHMNGEVNIEAQQRIDAVAQSIRAMIQ